MNILITSAGQRVSLVKFFKKELVDIFQDGKIYTTDLNPILAPACQISDKSFKVPRVTDKDYINNLLEICLANNIKLVIPTIDTELAILSNSLDEFKKNKISIIISDPKFVEICRDKRRINQLFEENGIEVPKQFDIDNLQFPLFIKPYDGSRSEGIYKVLDEKDFKEEYLNNKKAMFMEYISDQDYDEFTVDCYYDKFSNLKCVVPRKRIFVRAGEVNKGVTRKNIIVDELKNKISFLKGARGCITIQVFLNKESNNIKGIEINPRFGGGYPLSYIAGANYPKWIIEEYILDQDIKKFDDWQENLLMLRYDAEVIVHDYQ